MDRKRKDGQKRQSKHAETGSHHSNGRLAFKRVKGEPPSVLPKDCQFLERGKTILWEKGA